MRAHLAPNGCGNVLNGQEVKPFGVRITLSYPPDTDTPLLAQENETKPKITKLLVWERTLEGALVDII